MRFQYKYGVILGLILLMPCAEVFSQTFSKKQTMVAPDRQAGDVFGWSLDYSNNQLVLGSSNDFDSNGNNKKLYAGAAYIFTRDINNTFSFEQKITVSDREQNNSFGGAVACDNDLALIGSLSDLDANQSNSKLEAGAAYVFKRDNQGDWKEIQKIVASDRDTFDHFGNSLDLFSSTAVIAANSNSFDTNGVYKKSAGAVYLYEENSSGDFIEKQKIVASDRNANSLFGSTIYLHSELDLYVGASQSGLDNNGANFKLEAGAIYHFKKGSNGNWKEQQKLTNFDRTAGDLFGNSITGSNDFLVVGASGEEHDEAGSNYVQDCGSVYVYKRHTNGSWIHHQKLLAPYRTVEMHFGSTVSMNDSILVVGARDAHTDVNNQDSIKSTGAAFVFKKNKFDFWIFQQKIVLNNRNRGDNFGHDLVLEGNHLLISAIGDEIDTIVQSGTCTYYTIPSGSGGNGISDNQQGIEYTVFPNPSSGSLTIDFEDEYRKVEMKIVDITGKAVKEEYFESTQTIKTYIDGPPGLYLIYLKTASNDPVVFKMIKK